MRKLIFSVFCMSVVCLFACKSTDVSTLNQSPNVQTFIDVLATITCTGDNFCTIKYDPKSPSILPNVKEYIGCVDTKQKCIDLAKSSSGLFSNRLIANARAQFLKDDPEKAGALKAEVQAENNTNCFFILAVKKDGDEPDVLAKNMPGKVCNVK